MSATEVNLAELPAISLRRIVQLTLKAWPFIRPLVKHLLILFGFTTFITLVLAGVGLVATDLFNNKILVGDKLQPLQAAALFVDDSYMRHLRCGVFQEFFSLFWATISIFPTRFQM